jgi:hypothetical protein
LRVVDLVPLDLRAVGDFRVPAALVRDVVRLAFAVDDFARVVERRVPFVADADLRVDAAFDPEVDFRRVVDFVPDVARGLDAAEDLRVDVDLRAVDDLRFDPEARAVSRLVSPARAVLAFSSCATPFATSSCASVTALSTGFRSLDRLDLVDFRRAAIAFSP